MSYCRFSSCDFQCDVYCYADIRGGYTTHVAANRLVLNQVLPPPVPFEESDAWLERHLLVMAWVTTANREPIGLEYDGEAFNDIDAASTAARLQMLKAAGYNVPQHAIDSLLAEAAESNATDEYQPADYIRSLRT